MKFSKYTPAFPCEFVAAISFISKLYISSSLPDKRFFAKIFAPNTDSGMS